MSPEEFLHNNVIVANVAKNHCYPIVEAAASRGYLKKFITSIYYRPQSRGSRLTRRFLERFQSGEVSRFLGRRSDLIPDVDVDSIALPEIAEQLGLRLYRGMGWDARPLAFLKNELFDWCAASFRLEKCRLFHGFEQCALFMLRRARRFGAVTVLDQPIMHRAEFFRIDQEQRRLLGAQSTGNGGPLFFKQHMERKRKEHELADYVFAGLDFVKRTMVDNGFPGERIFVIPYGVDVSRFTYVGRPRRKGFNILYVGPVHHWKGLHYLLESMRDLDVPDARLTIVGGTHPEWGPVFEPLIAQLGDKVVSTGAIPQAEMMRHYAEADVLAFPSLVGGIGLCCYEAMATGLPVITSEGDVVIRDGIDGVCVGYADIAGWRRALKDLAQNRDRRLAIGNRGKERVDAFTVEKYRAAVVGAYEEIAARVLEGKDGLKGAQC